MKVGLCKTKQRDWSKLPKDIFGYIMGSLYWSIESVCGRYPTIDKAWLITFQWTSIDEKRVIGRCKVKDTSLGKESIMEVACETLAMIHDSNLFGELVAFPRCPCLPHRPKRVVKSDPSAKCWVENLDSKEIYGVSSSWTLIKC
ncbi:hypothetical protein V6N12_060824 [Hibiscus sabdariffa]|uniref:Uncharacterized protein n=1 Tax=Hibiscus sabdariffa TaxID=183260 RepID=A0ABR2D5M8_9ROSI